MAGSSAALTIAALQVCPNTALKPLLGLEETWLVDVCSPW